MTDRRSMKNIRSLSGIRGREYTGGLPPSRVAISFGSPSGQGLQSYNGLIMIEKFVTVQIET